MRQKAEYKNPWTTLSSREIYKNEWLRLREDQVITPGGQPGIYGVVETSPAIAIVPLTENLETFLVGQYRYALNIYSWEIPEGGGHPGETPLESAQRELEEETGLQADHWQHLGELNTSNSICNEIGHVFLAEQLQQGASRPEHTEDITVKKIPFLQAYEQVRRYEIQDALAIISIYRVYDYLKSRGRL